MLIRKILTLISKILMVRIFIISIIVLLLKRNGSGDGHLLTHGLVIDFGLDGLHPVVVSQFIGSGLFHVNLNHTAVYDCVDVLPFDD